MRREILPILQVIWCIAAAPQKITITKELTDTTFSSQQPSLKKDDLKTAASSYSHQYSNWGGNSPGGYEYSVTGYGLINDKRDQNYGVGSYGNTIKNLDYPGHAYTGSLGNTGYANDAWTNGYSGYNDYNYAARPSVLGGSGGYGGNGGYGGYGGNGGLNSYSGYNNPYYQGSNHLGYGYYNRQPAFGNIYNSGITPSLVTGYRGYTR